MDKSIKVSDATYKRIDRIVKKEKRTIKAVVEIALEMYEKKQK